MGGFVWRFLVLIHMSDLYRRILVGGFIWRFCMAFFGGRFVWAIFGWRKNDYVWAMTCSSPKAAPPQLTPAAPP